MTWWEAVPAILWTGALVFLPGYLILQAWAVRGLTAVATAAPVSIGLLGGSAVAGPWLGLSWHVLLVVVPAVALAALGVLLRTAAPGVLGIRHRAPGPLRPRWTSLLVYGAAVLIPAALLTRGLTTMIISPENISQTYDNIFHLNAVRYILDSGSASSLTLGGMYSNGADPSLYPGAWHDLVSLVVQVSGASLPVAVNAVTLVIGAVVWPLSCMLLTARATGTRPVPMLFAGALSATFGAFPYRMVDFGVLYPYFLALALLPAVLALVVRVTAIGVPDDTPRRLAALALLGACAGLVLAHPSALLALLAFTVPIGIAVVFRNRPRRVGGAGAADQADRTGRVPAPRFWGLVLLLVAYLVALVLVWLSMRPSGSASGWPSVQTIPQALGQLLAGGFGEQGPSWFVLALTVATIGLLARAQLRSWFLAVYVVGAGLFIVVSAAPHSDLRDFLTGVWYNDTRRLAGLMPALTTVLCAITATALFAYLTRRVIRFPGLGRHFGAPAADPPTAETSVITDSRAPGRATTVAALVAALVLGTAGQYSAVNYAVAAGQNSYAMDADAPALSPPEYELLRRVDETVPEGTKIIGNPWSGTALAYALGERRTLTPHVGGTIPPKAEFVMNNLHRIDTDPRVCAAIRELNSHYVLAFAGEQIHQKRIYFDGLDTVSVNPNLTRVDSTGPAAVLYRVTGC